MRDAVQLSCGTGLIQIDSSLAEMSTPRVHWRSFLTQAPAQSPLLTVRRHASLTGQPVEGPLGRCVIQLGEDMLDVQVEDGPFLGELVLRLAWYVVTTRLGGVLVHASGIAHGETALIACGKSGDGKSTLARLCRAGGLRLLSDEVLQLFPDGRAGGTPFQSDFDNVGSPGLVGTRYFVALKKADSEALEPLHATEAAQLALAQCFAVQELALPKVEVRRRLLAFLGRVELRTLAFRKHPEVAGFVRETLWGLGHPA
ncbi:MAG: hypothetical protein AMXMBFR34_25050 [Myxococcaceae bacterium]